MLSGKSVGEFPMLTLRHAACPFITFIVFTYWLSGCSRYETKESKDGTIIRIDRWTGDAVTISGFNGMFALAMTE
jgi:hypothetical protein